MKYENTKSKLRKTWSKSLVNKYEIVNQQASIKRIKDSNKSPDRQVSKGIIDLSTEWELMIAPREDNTLDAWSQYRIQWNIDLKEMPIKLIPFIKYQVVYKITGEEGYIARGLGVFNPRVPVLFRLEDVFDSSGAVIEDFKKVTMMVGYMFSPFTQIDVFPDPYDIQAKLIIKLYNPELII